VLKSSTGCGQVSATLVGNSCVTEMTGAGLGGVVSGGVVKLTELLFADRLPAASTA
jgi:deoxyribose-phosphate aldolase